MKKLVVDMALMRSSAFLSLSRWGLQVYLRFLQKRQVAPQKRKKKSDEWVITNNGKIVFPYREAEGIGIKPREFRNSLDELQEKGFLDIAEYGKGGRSGESTLYTIDDRWRDYGTENFRSARKPRIKDTIQGRGWSAYNNKQRKKTADIFDSATADRIDRRSSQNCNKRLTKLTAVNEGQIERKPAYSLEKTAFRFAE